MQKFPYLMVYNRVHISWPAIVKHDEGLKWYYAQAFVCYTLDKCNLLWLVQLHTA